MDDSGLWRLGDRVLAPWEPLFAYAGTIAELQGDLALIEFDDGDRGQMPLAVLVPLLFEVGQTVYSRRVDNPKYLPATVEECDGDSLHLRFDDGEEWVNVSMLRVLRISQEQLKKLEERAAYHRHFQENLRSGDRVLAPWVATTLFVGTVNEVRHSQVHITFDDGDRGWVQAQQVFPLELQVGEPVLCRWEGSFHPAKVVQVGQRSVLIEYANGVQSWIKFALLCIPCAPAGPDARPSHYGSTTYAWPAWLAWLIPIIIVLLLTFARR